MKLSGNPSTTTKEKIDLCNLRLLDHDRIKAVERTGLMDSPREQAFDRLAELAARLLNAPLTIISLVGEKKQFFKAGYGLPSPYDVAREIPITESICRFTLSDDEIIANDSKVDALLMHHPTTEPWGIGAFISIPMRGASGHVLGAFCAIHPKPHHWSSWEIDLMRELTASVMTEIELRQKVKDLETERSLREQFVTTLSHDLRTPLNVARMCGEIFESSQIEEQERLRLAKMIISNIDRADRMIRDILDANQITAGDGLSVKRTNCDICEIARATVTTFKDLHDNRFVLSLNEPAKGYWDASALQRVIENLLTNAIKYGEPATPVTLSVFQSGESQVCIEVHNKGNPIDPESLERIFNPYHRSASATQGSQKGWGIGLTLVRGIVEAHQGSIGVTSDKQNGTTFTVRLPLDADSDSPTV